jgi:hypothetical protein
VPGILASASDTLIGSASSPAAAYVYVEMPDGQTAADRLQSLLANVLAPTDIQSAYTVTNPSSPIQVSGTELASGASATYQGDDGTVAREHIIVAVSGATGYALVVDLPQATDAASPSVAQTILGSFRVNAPISATPIATP